MRYRVAVERVSAREVFQYAAGDYDRLDDAIATAKRIVDRSLVELAARGRRSEDLYEYFSLFGAHPSIIGGDDEFSAWEYARERSREIEGESWYLLIELRRFAEAEPLMLSGTEGLEDDFGETTVARAEFYEQWGDAAADPTIAERAFREAERYFATFASWATSGGEGTARMADVYRVRQKADSRGVKT